MKFEAWIAMRMVLVALALPACGGGSQKSVENDGGSSGGGTTSTGGRVITGGTGGVSGTGTVETGPWIYGLAEGDGNLVATALEGVPYDPNIGKGLIFHSSDGLEWSRVATDLPFVPYGVAYGNGRFVTLATQYDYYRDVFSAAAYWSDDGITWTLAEIPATQCGSRLAYGNGVFLGLCDGGHLRSEDGASWEKVGPGQEEAYGAGVDFAGGTFVSFPVPASPTNVWVGDGETFDSVDVTGDPTFFLAAMRGVTDAFFGKSMYMCCFGEQPQFNRWARLQSDDGSTWTHGEELSVEPPEIVLVDGSLCIGFLPLSVLTLSGPTCETVERTESVPFMPVAAVKSGDLYLVAGGPYGESGIIASTDGASWTTVLSADN